MRGFGFGFSGAFILLPVHLVKGKRRLKPATTAQFFWSPLARAVKIYLSVLESAASSSLHDDASIHPARGHPTAAAATQLMQRIMVDHARRGRVQRVATGRRVKQKAATR
jgi:hypothetical protein